MRKKRLYLEYAGLTALLLLALACILRVSFGSIQASQPVPMPLVFSGEYSYDGESWTPLEETLELSARRGDLILRGRLEQGLEEGRIIRYYRNHIGATVYLNGERIHINAVSEAKDMGKRLFAAMCGRDWEGFRCPEITPGDEIEIRLYNPHRLGNESAYKDFLVTLCADVLGSDCLSKNLSEYGVPLRIAGGLCAVFSMMILGAAVAAAVMRNPLCGRLLKLGMLVLFSGCFILIDTIDASFWSGQVAFNTHARQLSMMLAVFCLQLLASDSMTQWRRTAAKLALGAAALLNGILIALALFGVVAIFDTLPCWTVSQLILCPALAALCALELGRAQGSKRLASATGLVMCIAVLLDIFGVGATLAWGRPCTKTMFLVFFVIHVLDAARSIIVNHSATIRAERLARELEDSRISIMLSQIQPHFLYNVLGTIRGLCREDPMKAWHALGDFSDYLRGNMSALSNSRMIHFTGEFHHIETYLRLEKMRMGDRLNVLYDIQEKDFCIPPLTIQPLVENAVKHGLFENGGGTLILQTKREGDQIVVTVQDDGVGFDAQAQRQPEERHEHIGLSNVAGRLQKLCGGRLEIGGAPGGGTIVTVFLHAAEAAEEARHQ